MVKLGSPLLKAAALHIHFKKYGLSLKILSAFIYLRLYDCASGKKIGKTYMVKVHERRRKDEQKCGWIWELYSMLHHNLDCII